MDRIISLLAALVGLIALGGAILVHVNADTQRAEMAAEIAQIKATVGIGSVPAPVQLANAAPPTVHIPSAEHLAPVSVSESPSSAAAEPVLSSSLAPLVASAPEPLPASSEAAASSVPPVALPAVASSVSTAPDVAAQLAALQSRISELEQANTDQASKLAAAQAQLAAHPSSASSEAPVATADLGPADSQPAVHADSTVPASVLAADGPIKDCIPLGTRFMGSAGDSFPLCKTKMVLKVAAVSDGLATITGPGDVAAGATVPYGTGCLLAVFSADTTGYAEMRVSCQ
jgi:hypothetical protein